ncbi:MAG: GNAT family N-acetyltransferase [Gemmatimonadaceae bacterium]|jgi:RimJ/RimL family protein N-acetyltransferase|nr:GNAT family N-acetyltransferase [Gemmatimonadaceae bacterium]
MTAHTLVTDRLHLVLQTTEQLLAWVDALPPEVQAEVSPEWIARLKQSSVAHPWTHGFSLVERDAGTVVGSVAFKGPPDAEGVVEIAYGIDEAQQRRGFATEAAAALVRYAFEDATITAVRAHTKADNVASQRVLAKLGFEARGEVVDPEDGLVDRWERPRLPLVGTRDG